MGTYPFMVQTASNVLNEVFSQWHTQPYRWMRERDVQAEIGGRLIQIFALQGLGSVTGTFKWAAPGFQKEQTWSRVSYEPYIYYEYEDGKWSRCYPDIVIWDDARPGGSIPENQLWPVLWACELKYGSADDGRNDVIKLEKLIEKNLIKYGCAVRMHLSQVEAGTEVQWRETKDNRHLWVRDVSIPQMKGSPS